MDNLSITSTKKVCSIGTGLGIYFDKNWGFNPGDLVEVKVEIVRRGEDDAHDN